MPPRKPRVTLICELCGKTYTKPPSLAERSRYCSKPCRHAADSKKTGENSPHFKSVEVPCAQCGKTLQRIPARMKMQQHHFCNHACKARWQGANQIGENNPAYRNGGYPVICSHCGKQFLVNAWKIKHRTNHFCSQECYWQWKPEGHSGPNSPSWKGGPVDYYGPNWNSQRRKARKRDGYKCQHCGTTEKKIKRELDVHHIKPFRSFSGNYRAANHLSNLISLCGSCHMRAEHGKIPLQTRLI